MCKLTERPWNFYVLDVFIYLEKKNTGYVEAMPVYPSLLFN
jgi:hypothetical protein